MSNVWGAGCGNCGCYRLREDWWVYTGDYTYQPHRESEWVALSGDWTQYPNASSSSPHSLLYCKKNWGPSYYLNAVHGVYAPGHAARTYVGVRDKDNWVAAETVSSSDWGEHDGAIRLIVCQDGSESTVDEIQGVINYAHEGNYFWGVIQGVHTLHVHDEGTDEEGNKLGATVYFCWDKSFMSCEGWRPLVYSGLDPEIAGYIGVGAGELYYDPLGNSDTHTVGRVTVSKEGWDTGVINPTRYDQGRHRCDQCLYELNPSRYYEAEISGWDVSDYGCPSSFGDCNGTWFLDHMHAGQWIARRTFDNPQLSPTFLVLQIIPHDWDGTCYVACTPTKTYTGAWYGTMDWMGLGGWSHAFAPGEVDIGSLNLTMTQDLWTNCPGLNNTTCTVRAV